MVPLVCKFCHGNAARVGFYDAAQIVNDGELAGKPCATSTRNHDPRFSC
jgi:hypothetical protein